MLKTKYLLILTVSTYLLSFHCNSTPKDAFSQELLKEHDEALLELEKNLPNIDVKETSYGLMAGGDAGFLTYVLLNELKVCTISFYNYHHKTKGSKEALLRYQSILNTLKRKLLMNAILEGCLTGSIAAIINQSNSEILGKYVALAIASMTVFFVKRGEMKPIKYCDKNLIKQDNLFDRYNIIQAATNSLSAVSSFLGVNYFLNK